MALVLDRATVAVTGATGFIGRYLVEALVARGATVRAVVRRPDKAKALFSSSVEIWAADLADQPAMTRAFEGVDAVMANAALVDVAARDAGPMIEANVKGVERTYRAMADAGVRRAVHTSSVTAYLPKRDHFYHEDDPVHPPGADSRWLNHYGVTKAAGEHRAREICHQTGIAWSACRPHTVYGNHDRGTFTRWFLRVLSLPVTVFPAYLHLPSIYAGDLAEAMCRMLERDTAADRVYNTCTDPDQVTYWQLMDAYRRAGGAAPRMVVPLPLPLRRRYSTQRMRSDLDFVPRSPVDAFREMLAARD